MTSSTSISIESAGKIKYIEMTTENDKVSKVRVNMGEPILKATDIPVVSDNEQVIDEEIEVNGSKYRMTCVSMGNPHAIVFVDDDTNLMDLKEFQIEKIGPYFENHKRFPERTNTEFVKIIDRNHVEMRVWERGTGETLACGTGCCATTVACIMNGLTDNSVTVKLLGGELLCEWDRENNLVYMTGPAVSVFEGYVEI